MDEHDVNERFERLFFSRVPPDVARSFTDDQMSAIKTAFGPERWDRHPVDLRGTLVTPFGRWYYAIVAGKDRRGNKRRRPLYVRSPLRRIVGATVSTVVLIWLALIVFYVFVPSDFLPAL